MITKEVKEKIARHITYNSPDFLDNMDGDQVDGVKYDGKSYSFDYEILEHHIKHANNYRCEDTIVINATYQVFVFTYDQQADEMVSLGRFVFTANKDIVYRQLEEELNYDFD